MADSKAIFDDSDCESSTAADSKTLLDSQPSCLKCGQVQRMMKCCTRCHSAFYCSKTCFAKHWSVHKKICQPQSKTCEHAERQSSPVDSAEDNKTMYQVIQHKKPTVSPTINFQKAADTLSATNPSSTPEEKPKQLLNITDSTNSKLPQLTTTKVNKDDDEAKLPGVEITLRYNKQKTKFKVLDVWDPPTIFSKISTALTCLPDNMRVIHKGKQLRAESVRVALSQGPGVVFQVLGEPMEDASGLVPKDIDVLMQQMGVERNAAVRALRQSRGDLIDAMMAIGNK